MTQPTVRVLQIDQDELTAFVDARLGSPVSAGATELTGLSDVTLDESTSSDYLHYDGATWVNQPIINAFTVGDGLDGDVWEGSPITIQVDSTVARRDATNTFQQANTFTAALVSNSSAAVVMNSAAPGLIFDESDAAADNQVWRIFAEGATLTFDIRNDAGSITNNWLTVGRSGATAGAIALFGTTLTFNGIPVIVGGSPYTGGGGGDFVGAGSPAATINDVGLLLSNTFRWYDPTEVANLDVSVDGAGSTTFLNSNSGSYTFSSVSSGPSLVVGATSITVRDGINLRIFDDSDAFEIDVVNDGKNLVFDNNGFPAFKASLKLDDMGIILQGSPTTRTMTLHWNKGGVSLGSPFGSPLPAVDPFDGHLNMTFTDVQRWNVTGATLALIDPWLGPGNGPLLLESAAPIIEFRDTNIGDSGVIEFANTAMRMGTLSQGSPNGPGYDGLLTVGHTAFSPSDGLSFFDFTGYSASFTLTGGDLDLTTSGTTNINSHTIIDSIFVGTGSPALLATQTTSTDGVLSSVKIQDAEGLDVDVGFNQMLWKLKNATMGTTDDDWRSHAGHVTISDDGSAYTWTTPASTDGVVPSGATYTLANVGAGNITIAAGSGVTLTWLDGDTGGTGSRTLAQYGIASLSKRSATAWFIWGTGIT